MQKMRWTASIIAVLPFASTLAVAQANPQASSATQSGTQRAYMNVGFAAQADFGWSSERSVGALQLGDHDPRVRGFTIPNTELSLDGAVDPYFRGFANIIFKLDSEGETGVELEEAYVLSTSLPLNLQLKAGQFFAEFGRLNTQHPHAWGFVDQPLAIHRVFGPEGMRGQGARLSWLAPTSWFTEVGVGVLNSAGGTTYSFRGEESFEIHGGVPEEREVNGASDLLVVPRVSSSFELSPTQTVVVGASAALGPNNSGQDADTRIFGGDLYWKWKSASAQQGFPFVSLQTEVLYRHYDAASRISVDDPLVTLPDETLIDRGIYAQLLWGIRPRMVTGFRADFANGSEAAFDNELRAERMRLSPNVTWYPSEFSKFRVQYNYEDRKGIGIDHSLWFQFEFLLGAHAAHVF